MTNAGRCRWTRRCRAAGLALALLAAVACGGLDEGVDPDLSGPADLGISVDLTAAPDIINADGISAAVVRLKLRDNRGRAISGRAVLFEHDGDGGMSPSPSSRYVGPVQVGLVMATDQEGYAEVIYRAGTGIGSVNLWVRPYGSDSAMQFYRRIEIWQR